MSDSLLLVRWLAGSHAYGVAGPDSDKDYVEVYAENPEYVTGMSKARNRQNVSEEEDVARYPLRNWANLTQLGNPNMVETLFIEPEYSHPIWTEHIAPIRDSFLHAGMGDRFKGYATGQVRSLEGERNMKTNRPELVEKYGWDTKWGYHALRVACEGVMLMFEGELRFPLPDAKFLIGVRNGEVEKEHVIKQVYMAIDVLASVQKRTVLPTRPDTQAINDALHAAYLSAWSEQEG